jgi:DNA-binding transcriptional ArsR family regulator
VTWRQLPAAWSCDLAPLDKLVLLCLCNFANATGRSAKPAQSSISRLTGVGPRRVRTALAMLKQRGIIAAEGKGRRGTISYAINLPLAERSGTSRAADPGTVSPTIQGMNPVNKKDSVYFDSGPGNTKPLKYRATKEELIDEHERRRAAGLALTAGDHRPKW